MTVVRLTASHPRLAAAVDLLDAYRQHYGANPAREATEAWLRDQLLSERMRLYVAGEQPRAFCTVAVVPASLTLRTVWLVRDLFVAEDARRGGLARALLAHVAQDARAEGAHRMSLQAEAGDPRAERLYARAGFTPVAGLTLLDRVL